MLFRPRRRQSGAAVRLDARDRACRLATNAGLNAREKQPNRASTLLANLDYAWDPAWLKAIARQPGLS